VPGTLETTALMSFSSSPGVEASSLASDVGRGGDLYGAGGLEGSDAFTFGDGCADGGGGLFRGGGKILLLSIYGEDGLDVGDFTGVRDGDGDVLWDGGCIDGEGMAAYGFRHLKTTSKYLGTVGQLSAATHVLMSAKLHDVLPSHVAAMV
jgi:hypothetical protein